MNHLVTGKRSKNTHQTVSLVILTTKRNLGQRNQGRLGKSKTPENHISTATFTLQHHLQHLIIGYGMSSKSSFPHNTLLSPPIINAGRRTSSHTLTAATTKAPPSPMVDQIPQQHALRAGELDTGKATAPMEEISEDEAESFEDKSTFLPSFHFMSGDFDKGSLRKNLEHWHHIGANPSVIDTIENGYNIPFFTTPVSNFFQNNQSALRNTNFVTYTVKELLKSGRIKETRALLYIASPLTVAKNSHNKSRLILDLGYVNSFVYKDKIKFDDWRTM